MKINLYPHQKQALEETKGLNRVAYYLDMGLGKTFVGSEKAKELDEWLTLVVCQKSLMETWEKHFLTYYDYEVLNCSNGKHIDEIDSLDKSKQYVIIINYDLIFRRDVFLDLRDYTLILDESSLIQNEKTKRSKYIMDLKPNNIILLSGTPTSGKYENLWTQAKLLGWNISKDLYDKQYTNWVRIDTGSGFKPKVVDKDNPYKKVDRLKRKFREHGAIFMKTDEVFELPDQIETIVPVDNTKHYKTFESQNYVDLGDMEYIGDTVLTKLTYLRLLASQHNPNKIQAFKDLVEQTRDRLIVFYNFNSELEELTKDLDRPISIVNGNTKDLTEYERSEDSITFIQHQAGSMGLNLQKANKMIYFSLTQRSELFEQSKKRIHRIGQDRPCFYYILETKDSIEQNIYQQLKLRRDYTDELFKEEYKHEL